MRLRLLQLFTSVIAGIAAAACFNAVDYTTDPAAITRAYGGFVFFASVCIGIWCIDDA